MSKWQNKKLKIIKANTQPKGLCVKKLRQQPIITKKSFISGKLTAKSPETNECKR